MTAEERVAALHERMDKMRQMRERRKTGLIGAAGAVLTVCLIWIVFFAAGIHPGGAPGQYSGATMLFENAGGYVLAAIIAFMAGVIITAAILRKRNRERMHPEENDGELSEKREEEKQREGTGLPGREGER